MMLTISQAARRFDLSRSTLLYYDRIGLLKPSARSASGYRLYHAANIRRLEKICFFRSTGVSLKQIAHLLDTSQSALHEILEKRLHDLNDTIRILRQQQEVIVKILGLDRLPEQIRGMNKDKWVELLRSIGMDDAQMHEWHVAFERMCPQGHHDFLTALGVSEKEVLMIRKWSGSRTV